MNDLEIWGIAVALAMDCLSVSLACGIMARRSLPRPMLTMASLFGLFQGGMLLIGFAVTTAFCHLVQSVDHWIAFALLTYLGVRMIWENIRGGEEQHYNPFTLPTTVKLAVATSIDALAVGVSLACLAMPTWHIAYTVGVVAFVSFALTLAGLGAGILVGRRLHLPMEAVGGCILILIGIRILVEHLS